MDENSSNPDRRHPAADAPSAERTPDRAPTPPSSRLNPEQLAAFRADVARKAEAIQEARGRFQRAKVVTQEALAFEVSLSF